MDPLNWKKSSWSGGDNGQCVELARPVGRLVVRDSKNVDGPQLSFRASASAAFLSALKADRLTS